MLRDNDVRGRFSAPSTTTPCFLMPRDDRVLRLDNGIVCSAGMDIVLAHGSNETALVIRFIMTLGLTSPKLKPR
jgi:hypothetical protein